jgi:Ca2+-binding EF-hand superfamily protein
MDDEQLQAFCDELFEAVDEDGSGAISIEEYKRFKRIIGKPEEEAVKDWKEFELDDAGEISKEQLFGFLRKKIPRPGDEPVIQIQEV